MVFQDVDSLNRTNLVPCTAFWMSSQHGGGRVHHSRRTDARACHQMKDVPVGANQLKLVCVGVRCYIICQSITQEYDGHLR